MYWKGNVIIIIGISMVVIITIIMITVMVAAATAVGIIFMAIWGIVVVELVKASSFVLFVLSDGSFTVKEVR